MTPVSHALLPVFFGQRWIPQTPSGPSPRIVVIVALSGVLPDLINPHLSLDARHTAWSHSLVAWLIFTCVVAALAWWFPRVFTKPVLILCSAAFLGHLGCGAITGGIAGLLPFSKTVHGGNYLPYWLWITCDGALLLYFYLIYRWIPLRRRFKKSRIRPDRTT